MQSRPGPCGSGTAPRVEPSPEIQRDACHASDFTRLGPGEEYREERTLEVPEAVYDGTFTLDVTFESSYDGSRPSIKAWTGSVSARKRVRVRQPNEGTISQERSARPERATAVADHGDGREE